MLQDPSFFVSVIKIIKDGARRNDSRSSGELTIERREQVRRGHHLPPLPVDRTSGHRHHHVLHVGRDQLGGGRRSRLHVGIYTVTR